MKEEELRKLPAPLPAPFFFSVLLLPTILIPASLKFLISPKHLHLAILTIESQPEAFAVQSY